MTLRYYEVTVVVRHKLTVAATSPKAAKVIAEASVAVEREAWAYSIDIHAESVKLIDDDTHTGDKGNA